MSQIQRQDNLFSAEDWKTIYRSFTQADFTSYDYDSIRTSMLNYIQTNYPEDFNDYIQSSEFIAIIDLLSYLGQSLAFRTDLNSRENFFDTAERRDSIIRLAKLVNYTPKRNVPARGLLKVTKVRTNEPLVDSEGTNLSNTSVSWNDPNNTEWYDQWLQICNSAFNSTNQFGDPVKSGTVNGVSSEIYNINSTSDQSVVKNISASVDGVTTSIDVVKSDIHSDSYFYEKDPDQSEPYNLIYKNDNQGFSSNNTGFFAYFKEGELGYEDVTFETPAPNRTVDISLSNINDLDVFVQKVSTSGGVLEKWKKVPSLFGQNTIYNSLALTDTKIFSVQSRNNDQVTVNFSDGNFGTAPKGNFRIWHRRSAGQGQVIRANRIQNKDVSITYTNKEGQQYVLTLSLTLNYNVTNSQASETDASIKQNAPKSYYSQDRMVNAEDYNIFPLTQSTSIQKIKAINKTHIGHSRYLDINDPTGTVKSVNVYGEDGILYKNPDFTLNSEEITGTVVDYTSYTYIIENILEPLIQKNLLSNYYYDTYKKAVESDHDANQFVMQLASTEKNEWVTYPSAGASQNGYLVIAGAVNKSISQATGVHLSPKDNNEKLGMIRPGTVLEFVDDYTTPTKSIFTTVVSVRNNGAVTSEDTAGAIQLDKQITNGYKIRKILPNFRTSLTTTEKENIRSQMQAGVNFGIGYHYRDPSLKTEGWYIIEDDYINTTNDFSVQYNAKFPPGYQALSSDTSWLVYAKYIPASSSASSARYEFTIRGLDYVFESKDEVRFFYVSDYKNIDSQTGKAVKDTIEILDINKDVRLLTNPGSEEKLSNPITFSVADSFTEQDGYVDIKKIKVSNIDNDNDGAPDNPIAHDDLLSDNHYVFFESYNDYDGYTYYRLSNAVTQVSTMAAAASVNGIAFVTADTTASNNFFFYRGNGSGVIATLNKLENDVSSTSYTKRKGYDTTNKSTYKAYVGRSFTSSNKLYFHYKHSAPRSQRIDPSVSNIIELVILDKTHYTNVQNWFSSGSARSLFPAEPTSQEIKNSVNELEKYKSISDQLIYTSAKFKLLFGPTADEQNQAIFRVVKIPNTNYTDNEIKTEIVNAINRYFAISNWDFGDTFYYSELAAFIHTQLSSKISSVVIVPKDSEAKFGDLFQIKAGSNELFFSTATVNQVEIVSGLTGVNLRSVTDNAVGGY